LQVEDALYRSRTLPIGRAHSLAVTASLVERRLGGRGSLDRGHSLAVPATPVRTKAGGRVSFQVEWEFPGCDCQPHRVQAGRRSFRSRSLSSCVYHAHRKQRWGSRKLPGRALKQKLRRKQKTSGWSAGPQLLVHSTRWKYNLFLPNFVGSDLRNIHVNDVVNVSSCSV